MFLLWHWGSYEQMKLTKSGYLVAALSMEHPYLIPCGVRMSMTTTGTGQRHKSYLEFDPLVARVAKSQAEQLDVT